MKGTMVLRREWRQGYLVRVGGYYCCCSNAPITETTIPQCLLCPWNLQHSRMKEWLMADVRIKHFAYIGTNIPRPVGTKIGIGYCSSNQKIKQNCIPNQAWKGTAQNKNYPNYFCGNWAEFLPLLHQQVGVLVTISAKLCQKYRN